MLCTSGATADRQSEAVELCRVDGRWFLALAKDGDLFNTLVAQERHSVT